MEGRLKNCSRGEQATESRFLHSGPRRPEFAKPASRTAWPEVRPHVRKSKSTKAAPSWRPKEYHWVVEIGGEVIGEVDLVHDSRTTARLRRLRIDPAWQRTAALSRLIQCVQQFCWHHGRLRLNLEPGCAPRWLVHMLERGTPMVAHA